MIRIVESNRAFLTVTGTSTIARELAGRRVTSSFDVEWVLGYSSRVVEVRKVTPSFLGHSMRPERLKRRILRCSKDFKKELHPSGIVAQELGNAIGDTGVSNRDDEYKKSAPYYADKASVINVGRQSRNCYSRGTVEQLDLMAPGTPFASTLPQ
jgi:hypothetical protein